MQREIDMKEVSDGRFYSLRDMVKAGCDGCQGCSDCCRGMGESIILDPYDICRMTNGLGCTFDELLESKIELNLVDGLILPNLKMAGAEERCGFLNKEGRCDIHPLRPGMCRIFPLGRYYKDRSFQYFLQIHECKKEPKTKVKVQKWIDTPDLKHNEAFIVDWHYFLKDLSERLDAEEGNLSDGESLSQREHNQGSLSGYRKTMNLYLLKSFYQTPYEKTRDFYEQFYERLEQAKKL